MAHPSAGTGIIELPVKIRVTKDYENSIMKNNTLTFQNTRNFFALLSVHGACKERALSVHGACTERA